VGQTADGLPPFLYLQPCLKSVTADVGFDTTAVSNGTHHLTAPCQTPPATPQPCWIAPSSSRTNSPGSVLRHTVSGRSCRTRSAIPSHRARADPATSTSHNEVPNIVDFRAGTRAGVLLLAAESKRDLGRRPGRCSSSKALARREARQTLGSGSRERHLVTDAGFSGGWLPLCLPWGVGSSRWRARVDPAPSRGFASHRQPMSRRGFQQIAPRLSSVPRRGT